MLVLSFWRCKGRAYSDMSQLFYLDYLQNRPFIDLNQRLCTHTSISLPLLVIFYGFSSMTPVPLDRWLIAGLWVREQAIHAAPSLHRCTRRTWPVDRRQPLRELVGGECQPLSNGSRTWFEWKQNLLRVEAELTSSGSRIWFEWKQKMIRTEALRHLTP